MNKRGFTLVELLAVITVLGILTLIAIPAVTSIIDKGKNQTYIADAKKLIANATAEYNRSQKISRPKINEAKVFYLSYLDNGEFTKDPQGYTYDKNTSFVAIKIENGMEVKYVQLRAVNKDGTHSRGIKVVRDTELSKDTAYQHITSNFTALTRQQIGQAISTPQEYIEEFK